MPPQQFQRLLDLLDCSFALGTHEATLMIGCDGIGAAGWRRKDRGSTLDGVRGLHYLTISLINGSIK